MLINNYVSGLDIYYTRLFIIILEYILLTKKKVCCEIVYGVTVAAASYILSSHLLLHLFLQCLLESCIVLYRSDVQAYSLGVMQPRGVAGCPI